MNRLDVTNITFDVQDRVAELVDRVKQLPADDARRDMTAIAISQNQQDTDFKGMSEFCGYPLEVKL